MYNHLLKVFVLFGFFLHLITGCQQPEEKPVTTIVTEPNKTPYIQILGTTQDAGFPQAGCELACCQEAWLNVALRRNVSCLGIVTPMINRCWLLDATPDFKMQLYNLQLFSEGMELGGVLLTHAHIGHYTGLMHLGMEAMGAKEIPVFALPRMKMFLEENGPWSQLVQLKNIVLHELKADSSMELSEQIWVEPFIVPHRDEYSETAGYRITGPSKSVLFIPDIDKWSSWKKDIKKELEIVDIAFLDGTFFDDGELPGRDMSEIPHPFINETMQLLAELDISLRSKVHFIHFNHTNPVLNANSEARKAVLDAGFNVAKEGMIIYL